MKRMTWALAAVVGLGLLTTTGVANADTKVPVRTAQLSANDNTQVDMVNHRYGRGWYGGRGYYGGGYGRGYYGYRGYPRAYGYRSYYRPNYGYGGYYNRPYYYGSRPYYGYGPGVYLRF